VALKEILSVAVGVPSISPVDVLRVRPGGNARSANQENGKVPPDADSLALYGCPTLPLGNTDPFVMSSGGTVNVIDSDSVFDMVCCVGSEESVTVKV
jgi:hypothetical protein